MGLADCPKGAWLCPKCNHNKCTQLFNTVSTAFQFSRLLEELHEEQLKNVSPCHDAYSHRGNKGQLFWTVLTRFQAIQAMNGKLIQQSLAKTSEVKNQFSTAVMANLAFLLRCGTFVQTVQSKTTVE